MRKVLFIWACLLLLVGCGGRNHTKRPAQITTAEEEQADWEDSIEEDLTEEDTEMIVLKSDDGKVTVYGWERPHDGTMGSYGSKVEYTWKGKTLTQAVLSNEVEEPLLPMNLYTLGGGKYILYQYFREWSSQGYIEASTYELTADGLESIALFESADSLVCRVNVEYNIPDWYFRAGDGDGYEWLYHFNKTTKTLYHPSSPEYNFLSDRYIPYVWNGKTLRPGEEVGNPFLNASLQEYASLVSLFRTKRNLVRIDAMPDDSFRYAAWPKRKAMRDKPELVILGGTFDEDKTEWIFENEDYEYHCSASELYVLKAGKEIGRWPKI